MAHYHLVAFAFLAAAVIGEASGSSIVGLDLHHRSSPTVRRWAEARGHPQLPAHGTPEYYSELSRHDRALLARRGLAGADGFLSFAAGNGTYKLRGLGFLYYALVSVGTPNATFLVALDTGSDLFWVPCDCKQCAPFPDVAGLDLRAYSPRESTTSKQVTCDHELCYQPSNACSAATNGSCPYTVRYVSANTSSSGVLVEDVVHLSREGSALEAHVVLGCGQVQTGLFLMEGGCPDGLLGLGINRISVPSVLAGKGLVESDSFSMCFSEDGHGRINFGDAGGRGQAEAPFVPSRRHPTYNVSFTSINVGSESSAVEFAAVMDSGTSFTYLNEPEYSALATNFNSRVREARANFSFSGGSLPFEYCYGLSAGQTKVLLPKLSLTAQGGAAFPVLHPIYRLLAQDSSGQVRALGYCLAIIRNHISINIIGQNFMTGLKVVFDRERSVLGWQESDCYNSARAPESSPRAAPPPRVNVSDQSMEQLKPSMPPLKPSASAGYNLRRGHSLLLLPLLVAAALG